MNQANPALFSRIPEGNITLFFTQLFSTLSFSVLYSTLALYATQGLGLKDTVATSIIATFVAFNYALHLLGGAIGGRYLSYRSLFCIGMVFITIGCLAISEPTQQGLYWGLAAFLTGSGLNVTCINCMLTQLFAPTDKRRESAFMWNYSAMNIGFFIGFAVAGFFQIHHAYMRLFLLSGVGNLAALLVVLFNYKILADIDTIYAKNPNKKLARANGIALIIIIFLVMRWLLVNANFSLSLVMWLGACMAVIVIAMTLKQPTLRARNKLWAYFILALAALIFWTLYQLIPMGLVLFIQRNVDRHAFGLLIPPQWYQNINAIIIIFAGPMLAYFFQKLRKKGYNINIPLQFSTALLLIGISLAILPIGISLANPQGLVNSNWILACYILLTFGELCISPVGYAMVGQLAPQKHRGVLMGYWLMLTGIGGTLSNFFSKQMLGKDNIINPLITNASFSYTFSELGWISIALGILLLCFTPLIYKKLIKD